MKQRTAIQKIICLLLIVISFMPAAAAQSKASEELGMAIEYFNSRKYHEALLKLEKLDKHYKLNPRYHAYMGVCYYYEWQYEKAILHLHHTIPLLTALNPHERSFYLYADAESHFCLAKYTEAIPLYEQMLNLCHNNEKADALYRIGFCYLLTKNKEKAYEYFTSALAYYKAFNDTPDTQGRISQLKNMMNGLQKELSLHTGTDK